MWQAEKINIQLDQGLHQIGVRTTKQQRWGPNNDNNEDYSHGYHLKAQKPETTKRKNWRTSPFGTGKSGGQHQRNFSESVNDDRYLLSQ